MAKLVIDRFEEMCLFPDLPVKHYKVFCALVDSKGVRHETWCNLFKEDNSPMFNFGCFDNSDIDEFDFKNKWAMSEMVIRWANENISPVT